jgi:hypothetical protein
MLKAINARLSAPKTVFSMTDALSMSIAEHEDSPIIKITRRSKSHYCCLCQLLKVDCFSN